MIEQQMKPINKSGYCECCGRWWSVFVGGINNDGMCPKCLGKLDSDANKSDWNDVEELVA